MADKKKLSLDDLAENAAQKEAEEKEKTSTEEHPSKKDAPSQPKKLSMRELANQSKKNNSNGEDSPKLINDLSEVSEKVVAVDPVKENWKRKGDLIDENLERVKKDLKENVMLPFQKKYEEEIAKEIERRDEELFKGEAEISTKSNTITNSEMSNTTENTNDDDDPLKDVTKDEVDEGDAEINALLGPAAKIPGHEENKEVNKIDTTPVQEDDEMKALLKELEDGDEEEEFHGETEAMGDDIDLSKLTPEEEKREEEWAKKMVEAYRTGLRDALERKGKVGGANSKEMKTTTHAISFSQVLKDLKNEDLTHTASFPLIHTGRMIRMRALSGDEIPDLDYQNYSSDMEASRAMYNLLYRHDVSANKPATFNEWLRSICDWDIFNIYMALYIATFRDSNFIPYNCPECQNMFFEERDIKEMYRKHPDASDDFEERVKKIEELGDSSFNSSTKPVYTPISARFGLDLHAPSIYSATFETASLESSFINKHRQAVNLIQYIGDVYAIKPGFDGKPERSKINFKIDRDNETKTVKLKIIAVEKIISSLSTDEAAALSAYIGTIIQKRYDRFEFLIPGTTCHQHYGPKKDENGVSLEGQECGHKIEEIARRREGSSWSEVNPLDLLFTRHRLTQFAYLEIE